MATVMIRGGATTESHSPALDRSLGVALLLVAGGVVAAAVVFGARVEALNSVGALLTVTVVGGMFVGMAAAFRAVAVAIERPSSYLDGHGLIASVRDFAWFMLRCPIDPTDVGRSRPSRSNGRLLAVAVSPVAIVGVVWSFGLTTVSAYVIGLLPLVAIIATWAASSETRVQVTRRPLDGPDEHENKAFLRTVDAVDVVGDALCMMVVGALVVALTVALPESVVADLAQWPAFVAMSAIVLAIVSSPGVVVAAPAALVLAPFGIAAQIAFVATAVLFDRRFMSALASRRGIGTLIRYLVVGCPFVFAAAVWGESIL